MRITTWNARGLNAPSRKRLLKNNLKLFDSEIILIQETKLDKIEIPKIDKRLGLWNSSFQESIGASGGLGILWNPRKVDLNIISLNTNWMSGWVQSLKSDLKFIIINIYGPITNLSKRLVWEEIGSFINNFKGNLFLIGGDFNTILSINEKIGGNHQLSQASKDFKAWCDSHSLIDIPISNGIYTWNNRRQNFAYIAEKLDRFMIKGDLDAKNMNFHSSILPIAGSDHFPVRFEFSEPQKPARNPFKCEKMWFLDADFLNNIKEWWAQDEFVGSKMYVFVAKMKKLKERILRWNKEHFKDIFKEKIDIENQLKELNSEVIKKGMNNDSYMREKELLARQEDILTKEESFWRQKSREKWLDEGDRNTKYFHNSTLYNRSKSKITTIKNLSGILSDKPSEIAETFVKHFQNTLNNYEGSNRTAQDKLLKVIPKIVTMEDNKALNKPISLEEVKLVVFEINPDKSPGPDGFQAFFFSKMLGYHRGRPMESY